MPDRVPLTTPIPPQDLLHITAGHTDTALWADSREAAVRDVIITRIQECGGRFDEDIRTILDFGCGCGRLLAGWEHALPRGARLTGVDINRETVRFCKDNIPFADVHLAEYLPQLPFPDACFDLAYAASVFTHLTLPAALQWAGEICRLVRPGGYWLVSYHGESFVDVLDGMNRQGARELRQRGYYLHLNTAPENTFPGSNDYAAFMTLDFVVSLFHGFDLIKVYGSKTYGPNHFAAHQDQALFRRWSPLPP